MGVVFFLCLFPLIAAALLLFLFIELFSRIFVLMAPQIFIAVMAAYFHLKKKNIFRKYDNKHINAAAVALKIIMIIYMIFNALLFLFCLGCLFYMHPITF